MLVTSEGRTGTGKTRIAAALHEFMTRKNIDGIIIVRDHEGREIERRGVGRQNAEGKGA